MKKTFKVPKLEIVIFNDDVAIITDSTEETDYVEDWSPDII